SFPRPGYTQTSAGLPLVGVLVPAKRDTEIGRQIQPTLRKGLEQEGLIEGKHYSFAIRLADGDFSRLPSLAKELSTLKPRVIVAASAAIVAAGETVPDFPLGFHRIC